MKRQASHGIERNLMAMKPYAIPWAPSKGPVSRSPLRQTIRRSGACEIYLLLLELFGTREAFCHASPH